MYRRTHTRAHSLTRVRAPPSAAAATSYLPSIHAYAHTYVHTRTSLRPPSLLYRCALCERTTSSLPTHCELNSRAHFVRVLTTPPLPPYRCTLMCILDRRARFIHSAPSFEYASTRAIVLAPLSSARESSQCKATEAMDCRGMYRSFMMSADDLKCAPRRLRDVTLRVPLCRSERRVHSLRGDVTRLIDVCAHSFLACAASGRFEVMSCSS
jgi:hypothetical protein